MNEFVSMAGSFLLILGLILYVVFVVSKKQGDAASTAIKKKSSLTFLILAVILLVFGSSFKIVPTGFTGVRTTFGQISNQVVERGFNFKIPFVQDIELVNNKQQDITIPEQVWGESSEKTPVYASDITVTYQIKPERSAWIYANVANTDNLITQGIVSSAVKNAMTELPASEVTVRTRIEALAKEKLSESFDEKYGENTIDVLKVVINQMDFEDSYNEAIAEKSIAIQNQATQEIKNNTAIAKAEADKQVAITNAEAAAEAKRIAAQAEADANKLLTESLTDPVIRSKFYEKWDGKLPKVMGENAVITDIDTEE